MLAFLRQTCLTYVCTQILLLPLTRLWSSTCIQPSRPLACIMMLVWLILIFRVVLWYLPVCPWSWSYTFACMISVRLNQGCHKLVLEPIAYRNPRSNLTEVESSHWKTFTNMVVWLTGPCCHWVVLGSFTPCLYSETLISLLFGLNDFTKYNIRISLSLSPGEPLITDDRLLHVKTLKILSADNPRTCVHRFCNSLSSINSYG